PAGCECGTVLVADSTQLAALGTRQSGQPLTRSRNFNPKRFPQNREVCIARDQCSRPGRQSGFDKLIIVPVATNLLAQFHRGHPCGGRSPRVEPSFYLRVELFLCFDFAEHAFVFDKNRFGNDGANQTASTQACGSCRQNTAATNTPVSSPT